MPDGCTATLNVQGYEPGGRRQALRVLCNGADLGEQELSHEGPLVLRLDAAMLDGHGRTELVFLPRHHGSPAAAGHSEDRRELSFSLAWISFSARLPPADVIEPPIAGIDDAALMMGFESLGDDCEFGFAQRAAARSRSACCASAASACTDSTRRWPRGSPASTTPPSWAPRSRAGAASAST